MQDDVSITELKSRLSEYLRRVRRGRTLTVYNRTMPIAGARRPGAAGVSRAE